MRSRSSDLPGVDVKRALVKKMFDRVAPRYNLINTILTLGMDQHWRRRLVKGVGIGPGDRLVDVACGTGDLLLHSRRLGADCSGIDFSRRMLQYAFNRDKSMTLVYGDAANLPLADEVANVVTCGFALRNFVSLPEVWTELSRVLTVGGRLAILEVDRPENKLLQWFHSLYFDRLVPKLGGLISDREAYSYLPRSTAYLPDFGELMRQLQKAGFRDIRCEKLFFGSAQMIFACKA